MLTLKVLSALRVDFEFLLCAGAFPAGFADLSGSRFKVNFAFRFSSPFKNVSCLQTGKASLLVFPNQLMANGTVVVFSFFKNILDKEGMRRHCLGVSLSKCQDRRKNNTFWCFPYFLI